MIIRRVICAATIAMALGHKLRLLLSFFFSSKRRHTSYIGDWSSDVCSSDLFTAYGEGYGHVMFLNIKELVKPVSIGPGISGGGFDDLALRAGIDNARKQGGTVRSEERRVGKVHRIMMLRYVETR